MRRRSVWDEYLRQPPVLSVALKLEYKFSVFWLAEVRFANNESRCADTTKCWQIGYQSGQIRPGWLEIPTINKYTLSD